MILIALEIVLVQVGTLTFCSLLSLEMAKEKITYTLITTFGPTFEKNELNRNV